jgi:hypothetical protein
MILKKIGVLSAAKIYAILMAIGGLIAGIFFAIFGAAIASLSPEGGAGIAAGMGFFGIIFLPIIYGAMGFIMGVIGAWLYNVVAGWVGGIDLELLK